MAVKDTISKRRVAFMLPQASMLQRILENDGSLQRLSLADMSDASAFTPGSKQTPPDVMPVWKSSNES
ncbi:hypothetical protein [Asticcacaulis sp. MM231]|uniref:hypothetical protein n=1 Tax=Asticcacaulis sp. MM231 TaxID=3157666 RepID=UPI0032D5991A